MSSTCSSFIKGNLLLVANLSAVLLGVFGGCLLRYAEPDDRAVHLIGYPGELFMSMLKMIIIPLIVASLISGLAQLDAGSSGKISSRAVFYYLVTTTHAVILGIILVTLIHPGSPDIKRINTVAEKQHAPVSALDKFLDLVRNMFPENIVRASFQQVETIVTHDNLTDHVKYSMHYSDGMNVLGLIVFCIVMGVVISSLGAAAKPVADFFIAFDAVITRMVTVYMWFGPLGIASLIAAKVLEVHDIMKVAQLLGLFMLTVIIGLAIQAFITLPFIYFIASRLNPYPFLKGLLPAIFTALGTSSSAATLPITFQCLNDIGVDRRISKFVLPVGAVLNMDGTALYEAVGSIFIAQINGLELSMSQIITVSVTATLASIGAASIPSAGLVTMLIVLTAIGLPSNDISLILAVDFFLDRLRTSVNVIGDAFGCGFVYALCKDHINELPKVDTRLVLGNVNGASKDFKSPELTTITIQHKA